jgi:hypothetical protein
MMEIKISLMKLFHILRDASAVCRSGKYSGGKPARQSEGDAGGDFQDGSMWHCNNMARCQSHAGKLLFFRRRLARPVWKRSAAGANATFFMAGANAPAPHYASPPW